jgi:hypothetical protein
MKKSIFAKNGKEVNTKSLTELINNKGIMTLTNQELYHLRGGEGEEVTVIKPKKSV